MGKGTAISALLYIAILCIFTSMGRHPNFKNKKVVASNGYILVFVGKKHHLADVRGYAYEHRVNAEKKIGRRLKPGEQVHHIDHIKQNNDPDNLEVCASSKHHRVLHRVKERGRRMPDQENPLIECACGCGSSFRKFDSTDRPRKFVSGHNPQHSPTMDLIINLLRESRHTVSEIIKKTGKTKPSITVAISKLFRSGRIVKIKHGLYGVK